MNLHDEIINIKCKPDKNATINYQLAYKIGHRDALRATAELALKADKEMDILRKGIAAIRALIDKSEGVYGIPLDYGRTASWEGFEKGGRYESWLIDFNKAEELINRLES
ncbi:MAG: hypothetical protein WC856_02380 [Methylococcaceae bacterium]|jgi:hypothetical protein